MIQKLLGKGNEAFPIGMQKTVIEDSKDNIGVLFHLRFHVIAVSVIDSDDGICKCLPKGIIREFCPIICNFAVLGIVCSKESVDKINNGFGR